MSPKYAPTVCQGSHRGNEKYRFYCSIVGNVPFPFKNNKKLQSQHVFQYALFIKQNCLFKLSNNHLITFFFPHGGIQETVLRTHLGEYWIFLKNSYQRKSDILVTSGNDRRMLKVNILPVSGRKQHPQSRENVNFLGLFCETLKDRLRIFRRNTIGRISGFPSILRPRSNIASFCAAPLLRQCQSQSMEGKGRGDLYKAIFFLCQPELQPGNRQVPQCNAIRLS